MLTDYKYCLPEHGISHFLKISSTNLKDTDILEDQTVNESIIKVGLGEQKVYFVGRNIWVSTDYRQIPVSKEINLLVPQERQ